MFEINMSKDTLQDSGVELNCFKKKLFSQSIA